MELTLTLRGSTMPFSSMSSAAPVLTFKPAFLFSACFALRLTIVSMVSSPAFLAISLGISSRESAKALIAICSRPAILGAYARSPSATSISEAPPPATTLPSSTTHFTTLRASSTARSRLSTMCSVPPLRTRDTDFAPLQSLR